MLESNKNPNPTLDQYFMKDKGMLELIYDTANIQDRESIVEIGGGEGALTDYLIQGNNFVTVIEKDPKYALFLENRYKNYQYVHVIEGDALDYNYSNYDRIVANLPFSITEALLINLASSGALEYNPKKPFIKSITLVIAQNSLRKMVAPIQISENGDRHLNQEFGIMGAICKAFFDIDIVTAIPSESFYPEPAVTSFVINLTLKKQKTTVDRILCELLTDRRKAQSSTKKKEQKETADEASCELLTDKKETKSSIKKIFQAMLAQGKIYKLSKYNSIGTTINNKFTSPNIEIKNIYELSNEQISQLIQDLIKNDINIKSRSFDTIERQQSIRDIALSYFNNGKFVYTKEDEYEELENEDDDSDYEPKKISRAKLKLEEKYNYFYDSKQYEVLLRRGLENVEPSQLQLLLGNEIDSESKNKSLGVR